MAPFAKAVRKYLADRAEPETSLSGAFDGSWVHVLVVPARRETTSFLTDLGPAARGARGRLLVIVVVNGESGDAPAAREHADFLAAARAMCAGVRPLDAGASFLGDAGPFDALVVDRATAGRELPARRGVGLARKIGTDVALSLWAAGRIASPWIHGSDGDAVQPPDRFALPSAEKAPGVVAWTHPFRHEPSGRPRLDEATRLYDEWLRYHLAGLRFAGSPWAFPTIGSTITVRADALAAVRGFPRREAAEDFYLLAKLAKIGRVADAPTGPVRLRARFSDRVPFGTGAGVARIAAAMRRGAEATLDHPAAYALLGLWQRALSADDPFAAAAAAASDRPPEERRALDAALASLRVREAFADLPAGKRREWFDAFRTLKLLHFLRDEGVAPLPRRVALDLAQATGFDLSDLRARWHTRCHDDVAAARESTARVQDR